jgi:hypothetical protein
VQSFEERDPLREAVAVADEHPCGPDAACDRRRNERRAVGTGATGAREAALSALRDGGLDREAAARAERLLSTVIFGFAFSEASGRFDGVDVDEEFEAALKLLARLVVS